MSKPYIHAVSSQRRWAGKIEDYIPIHNFLDSSKSAIASSQHRFLTHNTWFIGPNGPLELAFGVTITNSDGKVISVREIGEQHVLEDYGGKFIPSAQDFLQEISIQPWMENGAGYPPSCKAVGEARKNKVIKRTVID